MLAPNSMIKTLEKLNRLAGMLQERLFVPIGQAQGLRLYETTTPLHEIPAEGLFKEIPESRTWGGDGVYGWFRCSYTVPQEYDGKALYLYNHIGAYEGTLWVDGRMHSNYAAKYVEVTHGNHYCNRITGAAKAGQTFEFALECYAYHDMPGTQPFENEEHNYIFPIGSLDVCLRDDEVMEFLFDLKTLISLRNSLPDNSFRKAEVDQALLQVHRTLYYSPDACTDEEFRGKLREASPYLKEQLAKKNSGSAPWVGLIGHSHMDTAWLWPISETEKKCARTYANQLNLMEEYPEYKFVQSSAYHSDIIRRNNPELFDRICKAVREGRYEPNGGVWVECDCNLTGGEYLIRQFVWGQRFTRKYFNYTADSFWLPDTFGYSFAIPQIMKGCEVKYFQTTKMAWGDTTKFPYTSFYWQGLDGTRVLTHLNRIHMGPSAEAYHEMTDGSDQILEKGSSSMRLFSFGRGDGGGGPEFEMLEMARRLEDLEGAPRSGYQTVSQFMKQLEDTIKEPSIYADEMYLELHRGTLTNQSEIKRNNRDCEIALHDLEFALVRDAVKKGIPADGTPVEPLMNTLLVRQFHDILPGTCIHSVHEETRRVVRETIRKADRMTRDLLETKDEAGSLTLLNPLSFERRDTLHLSGQFAGIEGHETQSYEDLFGKKMLAVSNVEVPALSTCVLHGSKQTCEAPTAFRMEGNRLTTPFLQVIFDDNGTIGSMIDRRNGRELVHGLPFNTFLMAEDVPAAWDNWDLDADEEEKFAPAGKLLERKIISDGAVELRIRSRYAISDKSTIEQDMVFDANSPMITFETIIDWQEEHRFLKTAFDTSLHCDGVRNEIQFGYIRRSNHRSTETEKARFEICNHKYSDLSENTYGIALLNDSKYGLSVQEGSMRLSLHKGGVRPDKLGDKGRHYCRYAILVHDAPFGAESVIRPAYAFNYQPVVRDGAEESHSLVKVGAPNVLVETVKPCEDAQNAYILRLYEATGDYARTALTFDHPVKAVYDCNMLEEEKSAIDPAELTFNPFQIRTIKVCY